MYEKLLTCSVTKIVIQCQMTTEWIHLHTVLCWKGHLLFDEFTGNSECFSGGTVAFGREYCTFKRVSDFAFLISIAVSSLSSFSHFTPKACLGSECSQLS